MSHALHNQLLVYHSDLAIDLNEYLPPDTLQFCHDVLQQHNMDLRTVNSKDALSDGNKVHRLAYLYLREGLRGHVASGRQPILMESPKPYAEGFQPSGELIRLYQDAGQRLVANGRVYVPG